MQGVMAVTEAKDTAEAARLQPAAPASVFITLSILEAAASGVGCEVLVDEQQKQQLGAPGVSVDVGGVGGLDRDKACRICHLSPDGGDGGPELIELGCGCKDDLANAHRDCAEAWFKIRGNRCCEICGTTAKNITGKENTTFMEKWHEGRLSDGSNVSSSRRGGCFREHTFCNFLMVCLVVAFVLPWLLHLKMF